MSFDQKEIFFLVLARFLSFLDQTLYARQNSRDTITAEKKKHFI